MEDVAPVTCPSLNVLILSEDDSARERVKEVYENLEQQFSKEFCFGSSWFDFEGLTDARTAGDAARAAVEADLILISANAHIEPPETVKRWVESWLDRKHPGECALGGLLNRPASEDGKGMPIQAYLTDVARRGGMDPIFEIVCTPEKPVEAPASPEQEKIVPLYRSSWNEAGPLSEFWPD
jgi:hypothetical protein